MCLGMRRLNDQRSEVRGQRSGAWLRIAECGMVLAAAMVLLVLGFALGRNYERINALAAEEAAPVVTINKAQAAARIQPRCPKARRDDVRLAVAGR